MARIAYKLAIEQIGPEWADRSFKGGQPKMAHLKSLATAVVLVVSLMVVATAQAHPRSAAQLPLLQRLNYQQSVLKHDLQVQRWFHRRDVRLLASVTPPQHTAAYQLWWHIQQERWMKREINQTTRLIRERLMGDIHAWKCIHRYEGSWTDKYDPFWGGLQMDREFMRTYGADMIRKYQHVDGLGFANLWTPQEQEIVAERARKTRGYYPWPNTARWCGLI